MRGGRGRRGAEIPFMPASNSSSRLQQEFEGFKHIGRGAYGDVIRVTVINLSSSIIIYHQQLTKARGLKHVGRWAYGDVIRVMSLPADKVKSQSGGLRGPGHCYTEASDTGENISRHYHPP